MTTDDMVSIPRELAERLLRNGQEALSEARRDLDAILNPPPKFDPEMVEAMAKARYELRHPQAVEWGTGNSRAPWRAEVLVDLTAACNAGWEMVETTELEALREFTALLFEGEEPELTDDELAYGIYFSDHLTDAQFYVPLSSAQRDAIRKAKAAQR